MFNEMGQISSDWAETLHVESGHHQDLDFADFGKFLLVFGGEPGGLCLGEPGGAATWTQHIKKKSKNPISRA